MDPVQDNTTPSGKDRSGWIIGIVVGALMALVSAAGIAVPSRQENSSSP